MDLHERLSASREPQLAEPERDSFSELKNRIHFAVISGLGPQLFKNVSGPTSVYSARLAPQSAAARTLVAVPALSPA